MKISFIGSGNVATHFAQAFKGAGHEIVQVMSREFDHAATLAHKVDAIPIDKYSELNNEADMYVVAVGDDALYDVALDLRLERKLVVHTSGATPMNVLKMISIHYGVLYAPQSFVKNVAMDYSKLPFCIEANDKYGMGKLKELAQSVSGRIYELDSEQRRKLHLASVVVNNFGNALNAMAQQMMQREEIPFELVFPLIEMTTQKIYQGKDLWKLQTGPAVRRDRKTIDAHRRLLAEDKDMLDLYDLMTQIIDNATH